MTIAACYLSTEGVVLGADSTSTVYVAGPGNTSGSYHHYTFAQKVFELGESSTVGIVTWGLGTLLDVSYRTVMADVADAAIRTNVGRFADVANLWATTFWTEYSRALTQFLDRARFLAAQTKPTTDEQTELGWLRQTFSVGFCLGGRWGDQRRPSAFEIVFLPDMNAAPNPSPIALGYTRFWGCPNLIERLLYGIDGPLFEALLLSGKWTGTRDELFQLVDRNKLGQPPDLPLREAIDWVHATIYATIKGMKFSHLAPVCGGPIEIAVITSDRPFRWVRHKRFDEAIL